MIRITAEVLDHKGEVSQVLGHLHLWGHPDDPWRLNFSLVMPDRGFSGAIPTDGEDEWPSLVAEAYEVAQSSEDVR